MTIEEEIFRKSKADFDKICAYGFKKENGFYIYRENIMKNTFQVEIRIDCNGFVTGKVYDLAFLDEYTHFRREEHGAFAEKVRDAYQKICEEIKDACFGEKPFFFAQSNRLAQFIQEKYGDKPEFEWEKFPGYAIFRNQESRKWYAIIMNLDKSKLDSNSSGEVEIINVKLDPKGIEQLLKKKGFYPAYHMNKKNWVTILLDDEVVDEEILQYIEESYAYTIV